MAKIAKNFKDIHSHPSFILLLKCFNLNILKIYMIEKLKLSSNSVNRDNLDFFTNKFKDSQGYFNWLKLIYLMEFNK